jgi:hypothetical protein
VDTDTFASRASLSSVIEPPPFLEAPITTRASVSDINPAYVRPPCCDTLPIYANLRKITGNYCAIFCNVGSVCAPFG